ncbi:MAG: pyridoxamine 5'-phosphate oxidase family protein [Nanoarchaeota archaeon]
MDRKVLEERVLEFIKRKRLAVISTINQIGTPESAVVAFAETSDLKLIFGTFNTTRKYQNLQNKRTVSFVIGCDEDEKITVQYEGFAREVKNSELEECIRIQLEKNPKSRKYAFEKEQRYFIITPKFIRYSDFSKKPEEIFELNF